MIGVTSPHLSHPAASRRKCGPAEPPLKFVLGISFRMRLILGLSLARIRPLQTPARVAAFWLESTRLSLQSNSLEIVGR